MSAARGLRRLARNDRGASSLETALLFPLLLGLVVGLLSGALGYHARNVALAAAGEGLRAATREGASPEEGAEPVRDFLDQSGGHEFLLDAQVAVTSSDGQVAVTVRGTSLSLLPGVEGIAVEQTAAGPRERFTTG